MTIQEVNYRFISRDWSITM